MDNNTTHDEKFKRHILNRYGSDVIYLFGSLGGLFSFFLIMLFIFCCIILGTKDDNNEVVIQKIVKVGIEEL